MGYNETIVRRIELIGRIKELHESGEMGDEEYDKYEHYGWFTVCSELDKSEAEIANKYPFGKKRK